ncbi:MAG TPA: FAD:protein FMN transferase [Anaerolineales bacterium]|nr:FAD:protein FMN transferase [Anaerolineales bacterium]
METFRLRAMNTDILLTAEGEAERVRPGFEQASAFIQAGEKRFTRFSEDSELSALNRSAGRRFHASPQMFSVVALARRFFHLTRGLFDPSILPDLQRAGYNRSMEQLRELGPRPLLETLLANEHASFSEMDMDESDNSILLPAGMALDLGGIAKGWIAEQAAQILSKYARAGAVDAGGDMFLVGLPEGLEQWPVTLEDPLQPHAILTTLKVAPGGIATSTSTKRVWQQAGQPRHHIIHPRTHAPAVSDWISVTAIAPHAYEAEVFAKALLIAGPQEADEIVRHSNIAFTYLAVDQDRKLWGTQGIMEHSYVDTETSYAS